mgnify:CR=1 FL=1
MLVIEHLHYATTSRYNFPQPVDNFQLPQKIIALSIDSMKNLKGDFFQPYEVDCPELTLGKQEEKSATLNGKVFTTQLTPLKPIIDDTPIIAIDVSSIKIGETETGILCAIRGAVVWSRRRQYSYFKLGPFPFHINEENKKEVINLLRGYHFPVSGSTDLIDVQAKLCNLMEKWIQMNICCSSNNSIILWDGSLTAGTSSNPLDVISLFLKMARERFNSVLAFSKMSKIRFLGHKITDLFLKYPPPWLFEVEETPFSPTLHLLGNVYIARFRSNGYSFRLDIDRIVPIEQKIDAVQRLIGNDLVFQSYPESLRLAHIYSTFTANEVIGIQHYIAHKFKLKALTRRNVRKMLFGPFGTRFDD